MINKTNQKILQSASLIHNKKKYQITKLNIQSFSGFQAQIKFIKKQKYVLLHGHNNLNYAKKVAE